MGVRPSGFIPRCSIYEEVVTKYLQAIVTTEHNLVAAPVDDFDEVSDDLDARNFDEDAGEDEDEIDLSERIDSPTLDNRGLQVRKAKATKPPKATVPKPKSTKAAAPKPKTTKAARPKTTAKPKPAKTTKAAPPKSTKATPPKTTAKPKPSKSTKAASTAKASKSTKSTSTAKPTSTAKSVSIAPPDSVQLFGGISRSSALVFTVPYQEAGEEACEEA